MPPAARYHQPMSELDIRALREESERRLAEAIRRMRASPAIEIAGIVEPRGPVGCTSDDGHVELLVWRRRGGAVEPDSLFVRTVAPVPTEWRDLADRQPGLSILHARVHLEDPPDYRDPSRSLRDALLVELLDPLPDPELAATARQLAKPLVVDDAFFGALRLDRRFGKLETGWRAAGRRFTLHIAADHFGRADLARARAVVERFAARSEEYRAAALAELDRYGEVREASWLYRTFVRWRVQPTDLFVGGDGRSSAYYPDAGVRDGHVVVVYIGLDGEVATTSVAG